MYKCGNTVHTYNNPLNEEIIYFSCHKSQGRGHSVILDRGRKTLYMNFTQENNVHALYENKS